MKKLNFLKNLINFFFLLSFFPFIQFSVFLFKILFNYEVMTPVKLSGVQISSIDFHAKIVCILVILSGIFFIFSVYLLKKVILHFIKNDFFNDEVITLLNKIGKYILVAIFIKVTALSYYTLISVPIMNGTFNSYPDNVKNYDFHFPLLCLGLFFMVISEAFKMAKNLKEENELTV